MTTEEKTKYTKKKSEKKPRKSKSDLPSLSMSKAELEIELRGLLSLAKSKENLTSAVAILKLIRELEANEQTSNFKAHWLDELMGMSNEDLELRIRNELAAYKTG